MGDVPEQAAAAVLQVCDEIPDTPTVKGYDFNNGVDLAAVLDSYGRVGFQSTNFGKAVDEVNRMLRWRLSDDAVQEDENDEYKDPAVRAKTKCTIFLSYTSNLISSGAREILRFLIEHKMVDVVVTTAGGIEEDFIKCLAPTYLGDFSMAGKSLRLKGLNRVGNMLVPNSNYVSFEKWLSPILDDMLAEQKSRGTVWTPSKMIRRLGLEIANPPPEGSDISSIDYKSSVYYWAAKNDIPVYCPAITDGSIGDMVYFHSYKNPGLVIDIAGDIRGINDAAINAKKSGVLILGGGVIKHHVLNANLFRNGADFSVFVNTGQEFDGSDSGARPDEAISWGKLKIHAQPVKIYAEATLILPLLVAQTFAKYHYENLARKEEQE